MGGASSLDKKYRKLGVSYWEEELPSESEMLTRINNLRKVDYKVDYVITHTAPLEYIRLLGCEPRNDEIHLNCYLDNIRTNLNFSHWYFGHFHTDKMILSEVTAVYYKILRIV